MTRLNYYTHITILISNFLSGTASGEELDVLEKWRKENVENEELLRELMEKVFWEQKISERNKIDRIGAYLQVIDKCKKRKIRQIVRQTFWVAASLVLSLSAGLWFLLGTSYNRETERLAKTEAVADSIVPGEVKAELLLADGSKIRLNGKTCDSLTEQAGSMIIAGGEGLKYEGRKPGSKLVYNTLKIPRGGEYTLTLEDGTVVYLNSETELKYPVQFIGNERKVELIGEAYFEVKHDAVHSFIVKTIDSEVKVLGTSFNLRSYPDEKQVAATLVEGKVDFIAANRQKVNLTPGEQVILDEHGQVSKREVDTHLYTAWKDGNFVFYKQRLEDVMRVVSRWYDVEVHFVDVSQKEVSFTGNVKRYDDFSKILRMLEMTGNTHFEINGRNVFIREK